MDPYRLPRHIVPTRYDIRLEPDLTVKASENEVKTFEGDETISLSVLHPSSEIVLNAAAELEILQDPEIENARGLSRRAFEVITEEDEQWRLKFRDPIPPGTWLLRLRFKGLLTAKDGKPKLKGFYRGTYKDTSGVDQGLVSTHFEPTAARQAFPCWDEPSFKAVFALTLVIDPALKAVSNTPVLDEYLEGGHKLVRFADTIPMSTYLVAFVVGDLQATEPTWIDGTPLRVWYVPDMPDKHRLAAFGQQIGEFSLRFFEEYYGQPYPEGKLDLLAIPDFAIGAMENLGAITFRQTRLLVDERQATRAELESVADTVSHENAHMWFGDLVTMSWWDGLWLKEAFATFMEALTVDLWKPNWQRWTTFALAERETALAIDGLHSTRPIEFDMADDPRDIEAMFDVLTYRKGAAVLRMIEQYLGLDVFRAGIRGYLRQHAYGTAGTDDLWIALGKAADRDVSEIMNGWIRRPGFPLISVHFDKANQQLLLSQQRFTYLKEPLPALAGGTRAARKQDHPWQVPIQLSITADGETTVRQLLLRDAEKRLELPKDFESVRVNESGHGFYRVNYDPELRESLLHQLPDLPAIERLNLAKDMWAATLTQDDGRRIPLTEYLDLAIRLAKLGQDSEDDNNVWVWTILIQSFRVLSRVIDRKYRRNLEAFVCHLVRPAFDRLGWEPQPGESELIPQLRADLLRTLGTLGNYRRAQDSAVEVYEAYKSNPAAVDGNIVAAVIEILAHAGDAMRYEKFFNDFKSKEATPQDKERYLYALAAFQQPDLLRETLNKAIKPEVIRPQDGPAVVRSLLMSVYGRELAWGFVKDHWEEMGKLYRQGGLSQVCAGVIGLTTPELERDVNQEIRKIRIEGQTLQQYLGGKTLEQHLEQLRVLVKFREREGPVLHNYLAPFLAEVVS